MTDPTNQAGSMPPREQEILRLGILRGRGQVLDELGSWLERVHAEAMAAARALGGNPDPRTAAIAVGRLQLKMEIEEWLSQATEETSIEIELENLTPGDQAGD